MSIAHLYGNDIDAVASHLALRPGLVEEALAYARGHRAEIDPLVQIMEEASDERLGAVLPGMRIVDVDLESSNEHQRTWL